MAPPSLSSTADLPSTVENIVNSAL